MNKINTEVYTITVEQSWKKMLNIYKTVKNKIKWNMSKKFEKTKKYEGNNFRK